MANAPSPQDISTVMDFTGFGDRNMISSALQAKNHNVEAVVSEFFDSPERACRHTNYYPSLAADREQFKSKYGWDESAFGSTREGDVPVSTQPTTPGELLCSALCLAVL